MKISKVVFVIAAAIMTVTPAIAQKQYALKFNHMLTAQDPYHLAFLNVMDVANMKNVQAKGVKIIPTSEIDMVAFKAAGEKAYQKLNLVAARDKIYQELGKKK